MVEAILSIPGKIADALVWLFDKVVSAVGAVASAIWDFFRDPLGSIGNFLKSIFDFLGGLVSAIVDGFKALFNLLFVPSSDYFDKKTSTLKGTVAGKINTAELENALNTLKGTKARSLPAPRASVLGMNINLQGFWDTINDHLDLIHMFIRAIMYALLLKYNIDKVYMLIRGSSMDSGGGEE